MQSADKKYFVYNKGINTEAPLVEWPEGFTVDEQNFDLLQDGSRRRRLGISYEAGGTNSFFSCLGADGEMTSGTRFYRWRNVNNTDEQNLIVAQIGSSLYFWDDPVSGPMGLYKLELKLGDYAINVTDPVTGDTFTPTEDQLKRMTCSFSEADGKLIVVGEFIEPFYLEFDDEGLIGTPILIEERDMFGIDDGVPVDFKPEELSASHQYNLFARGWLQDNIDAFEQTAHKYPSKNMLQFIGLRKQTAKEYADEDGIRVFSPDKLMAEIFQNMSAPLGHLTRNVFNRRYGLGSVGALGTDLKVIKSVDEVNTHQGYIVVTVNEASHGLQLNDYVDIDGMWLKMRESFGGDRKTIQVSGTYTVTEIVSATSFRFDVDVAMFGRFTTFRYAATMGTYSKGGFILVEDPEFAPANSRFTVTAAFAGRVFYGGSPDYRLTDKIYFSKTIETYRDFGKCLAEADPTSEYISDPIATDGGLITIPNLGTLRALIPYGNSLLCFSSEGVWAIGPGESGLFSALGYSVTKITDAGCIARQSVVVADNIPVYWSNAGIYALMQDSNSGFLSGTNITQSTINGLFHAIRHTEKTRVKSAYDPVRKRILFLYNSRLVNPQTGNAPVTGDQQDYSTSITPMGIIEDTNEVKITYDSLLIFDMRLKAWNRWTFGEGSATIRDILCLSTNYSTDSLNGGIRFLSQTPDTTKFYLGELTSTTYEDWGTESPAFIYTGPDSVSEPARKKTAPYVHVFMRKETSEPVVIDQNPDAFVSASPGSSVDLVVTGSTSSLFMQPRWDWARGADSGKISNYVQVYREIKPNPDAYGVVVTKNKVRGKGRNLFLAFKSGERSPCWLDGWTVKYDVSMRT